MSYNSTEAQCKRWSQTRVCSNIISTNKISTFKEPKSKYKTFPHWIYVLGVWRHFWSSLHSKTSHEYFTWFWNCSLLVLMHELEGILYIQVWKIEWGENFVNTCHHVCDLQGLESLCSVMELDRSGLLSWHC